MEILPSATYRFFITAERLAKSRTRAGPMSDPCLQVKAPDNLEQGVTALVAASAFFFVSDGQSTFLIRHQGHQDFQMVGFFDTPVLAWKWTVVSFCGLCPGIGNWALRSKACPGVPSLSPLLHSRYPAITHLCHGAGVEDPSTRLVSSSLASDRRGAGGVVSGCVRSRWWPAEADAILYIIECAMLLSIKCLTI